MADYDVLLFDVMGVLAEDSKETTETVLQETKMTNEELWAFWVKSPTVREFDTGRISGQEFGERLVRDLNLPVSPDEFLELFGGWIVGLYDGTEALLGRIPSIYKKACLSNTNDILWPPIRDEYGLDGLLDAYYLSHEMGMLKPDVEAFEYVIGDLDVPSERIAFFDDLEHNVNSARQVGLSAFQTKGLAELEKELERLGVL